jgi:hypothetical protein
MPARVTVVFGGQAVICGKEHTPDASHSSFSYSTELDHMRALSKLHPVLATSSAAISSTVHSLAPIDLHL